jgi:hypothetical protein
MRQALDWVLAHPAECWLMLSAIINLLLRVRSAEQWVALCERHPKGAAVARLVRALGVDPAGAIRALALLVSGKAAEATARQALPSGEHDAPAR